MLFLYNLRIYSFFVFVLYCLNIMTSAAATTVSPSQPQAFEVPMGSESAAAGSSQALTTDERDAKKRAFLADREEKRKQRMQAMQRRRQGRQQRNLSNRNQRQEADAA